MKIARISVCVVAGVLIGYTFAPKESGEVKERKSVEQKGARGGNYISLGSVRSDRTRIVSRKKELSMKAKSVEEWVEYLMKLSRKNREWYVSPEQLLQLRSVVGQINSEKLVAIFEALEIRVQAEHLNEFRIFRLTYKELLKRIHKQDPDYWALWTERYSGKFKEVLNQIVFEAIVFDDPILAAKIYHFASDTRVSGFYSGISPEVWLAGELAKRDELALLEKFVLPIAHVVDWKTIGMQIPLGRHVDYLRALADVSLLKLAGGVIRAVSAHSPSIAGPSIVKGWMEVDAAGCVEWVKNLSTEESLEYEGFLTNYKLLHPEKAELQGLGMDLKNDKDIYARLIGHSNQISLRKVEDLITRNTGKAIDSNLIKAALVNHPERVFKYLPLIESEEEQYKLLYSLLSSNKSSFGRSNMFQEQLNRTALSEEKKQRLLKLQSPMHSLLVR